VRLRREALTWRRSGDEVIVLDLQTSRYLSLNGTGALLWEHLATHDCDARELTGVLTARHDVATAAADVEAFLGDLRRHGLLASD